MGDDGTRACLAGENVLDGAVVADETLGHEGQAGLQQTVDWFVDQAVAEASCLLHPKVGTCGREKVEKEKRKLRLRGIWSGVGVRARIFAQKMVAGSFVFSVVLARVTCIKSGGSTGSSRLLPGHAFAWLRCAWVVLYVVVYRYPCRVRRDLRLDDG